jgi:hypothetical protein
VPVLLVAVVVLLSGCISQFSPMRGSTLGGTSVVIHGSGLTGATAVKFGSTFATSFTMTGPNTIVAVTPSHAAGSVVIRVVTPKGFSTSLNDYTFVTPPTITSFTPTLGPASGGTTLTITGTHFTAATAVTFGTTPAASYTVTSPTTITAVTSSHAPGTTTINVTTRGGTATAPSDYTYTTTEAMGTYSCPSDYGRKVIPATITDENSAPASLSEGTTYVARVKVTAVIPASLVRTVYQSTMGTKTFLVPKATLTIVAKNFTPPNQVDAASNLPIHVPINETTTTHGASITVTFQPTTWTVNAASGKATLTPGDLALTVRIPLACYPPSEKVTYDTPTTLTLGYTVSGSNTLPAIDTLTATAPTPLK